MAITKLPRNAIADDAINDSKIEDGTIALAEVSGTITNAKLKDGDIANAKLSNSTVTIRGTSRALGASFNLNVDIDWQSVVTGDTTMVAGRGYFVDTSSSAVTMTLPASASAGDTIAIKDYAGTFATNNLTIGRNSHKIQGNSNDNVNSTNRASLALVYVDSTKGWLYSQESNVSDLQATSFIAATGGTVTTSGDFKIHTFTGDGCFVVSSAGSGCGPSTVSYMVIAGGGGAGSVRGGGGGAGGFREGRDITPSYTASPLVAPTGLTITATTFPVTVGGGGAGTDTQPQKGSSGSNSIFSTITSAGGGGGGSGLPTSQPVAIGIAGGSGGGGAGSADHGGGTGGAGNTPPVSPPQGNAGGVGSTSSTVEGAGGGGGAGAAGANGSGSAGGNGGNGVSTDINASSVTRAGGGGGGAQGTGGTGGSGGGADAGTNAVGANATANTGGGGSGAGTSSCEGGNGGKGLVIVRYKFQ
jgi:hypothetical protein